MTFELNIFVSDFASLLTYVDQKRPQKLPYQVGIGPHTESETVDLIMEQAAYLHPEKYGKYTTQVPYPSSRQRCDLCFGENFVWEWAIEVKMVRFLGDNGKPADATVTHILSPYPSDHSALTDCEKLVLSTLGKRKAIMIYGFDYDKKMLDPIIEAFEALAHLKVSLGVRYSCTFDGLVHPIHAKGRVFAWEIFPR